MGVGVAEGPLVGVATGALRDVCQFLRYNTGKLGSSLSIRCKVSPGIYNASVASGPIDVKYAELNTLRSTNRTPCSLATSIVALLYHLPWESCTFDELKSVARPCGVDNTTVAPVALAFTTMSVIIP